METLIKSSFSSNALFVPKYLFDSHTLQQHSGCTNTRPSTCSLLWRRRRNIRRILCSSHMRENLRGNANVLAHTDMQVNVTTTINTAPPPTRERPESCGGGLGIVQYLQGKNYLITGATGFLAKVLIEKMLRTVPDLGKIYLLIKADDKNAAIERLENEIINLELFKCLKEMHGKSYKAFMMSKLIPVVGNLSESNLGMDDESAGEISKSVHAIVNSAGNTTFDERYDVALNTNTRGPPRLLSFAKKCNKLDLFLHVSTAYVNGEREGIIPEKPFCVGDSIARERASWESAPVLDIDAEIKFVSNFMESVHDNSVVAQKNMKQFGLQRANMNGWQNTYVYTKAMGEMLINNTRGEIPVVIIRPSVIESTSRDPFPGWIQGNRMMDPLILSYGKGQLPGSLIDPNAVIDIVPADMVVNSIIAAVAKHGRVGKPGLDVYHVGSSVENPILLGELFRLSHEYFTKSPLMDSNGKSISIDAMKYFNSLDDFSSYIKNEILVCQSALHDDDAVVSNQNKLSAKRLEMKCKKKLDHVIHLAKIYEPYMFYKGWFDNSNTQRLIEGMSEEEMMKFGFDVRDIDWKDYFLNIHIPGLRTRVIKRS